MIVKVANEQALTLDLTTVLYKYFEPLKAIRNLKIIVNEDAKKQMKEIGFEEKQIVAPLLAGCHLETLAVKPQILT